MTTKKLFLSILMFLVLFCLLFSIFGKSGYLVNRSLENYLESLLREEEERKLRLEALEERMSSLSSPEALNDIALSLGYNNDGDVVYYFETPDVIEEVPSQADEEEDLLFEGLDTWVIALISLASAFVISVIAALIQHGRHDRDNNAVAGKKDSRYSDFDW